MHAVCIAPNNGGKAQLLSLLTRCLICVRHDNNNPAPLPHFATVLLFPDDKNMTPITRRSCLHRRHPPPPPPPPPPPTPPPPPPPFRPPTPPSFKPQNWEECTYA
eukprot:jgi/Chrzof1/2197/Cz11g06020.t1